MEGRKREVVFFSLYFSYLFLFWREGMACAVRGSGSRVIHGGGGGGGGWYPYRRQGKVKYSI